MLLNLITCIAVLYAHNLSAEWIVAALVAYIFGQHRVFKTRKRIEYIEKIVRETVKARTGKEEP